MSGLDFFLTISAVFAGAIIYGSLGFGFAFIVIPVVSLVDPTLLPPVIWFVGMPFAVALYRRERARTELRLVWYLTGGKLIGTPLGVALLMLAGRERLEILFAGALLLATGLTVFGPQVSSRTSFVAIGVGSGVMGTAAALGGPPLSLALRGLDPSAFRATLALCFVIGDAMSLGGLALSGLVQWRHVLMGLSLMPAMVAGYYLSNRVIPHVHPQRLRLAVLVFAAASSAVILGEAIF